MMDRIKRAEKSGFLSLKDYGLEEIPPEVFALTGLKTLILSNNPLKTISKEISALKSLKTLQMADCGLFDDSLPEEITTLPLEELTLTSNGLTNFELLTKITSLRRLNLAGNDIVEIPASVYWSDLS
jgi:Leucine-rich repeat (LRR) protein